MFHLLSQHHFDTMFVILCVIAGASSHSFSNSSGSTPTHLLNHHRHAHSFIDLIVDPSLGKLSRTTKPKSNRSSKSYDDVERSLSIDLLPSNDNNLEHLTNICALLGNLLTGSHMKFCMQHRKLLEQVVPQILELAREECTRITSDLRWNCTTIRPFLDKSSFLASTREAALIRSLLNASMMYLIVKLCADHGRYSCGCASHSGSNYSSLLGLKTQSRMNKSEISDLMSDLVGFNQDEINRLNTGHPLRFSLVKRRGCQLNLAFAASLTAVLFDSEESKSLRKSSKTLIKLIDADGSRKKRMPGVDQRILASIKWTKSAVNLHNNNVGRQIVRMAVRERCRCHGISSACSLQTCWEEIESFTQIAMQIRAIYLDNSHLVEQNNLVSFDNPDIYLEKASDKSIDFKSNRIEYTKSQRNWIKSKEFAYLYESPEYCIEQPEVEHTGTKGRQCSIQTSRVRDDLNRTLSISQSTVSGKTDQSLPGSCEHLCCGRGYKSELVLHLVNCECRFKFCCKVVCSECPKQRLQHYCS